MSPSLRISNRLCAPAALLGVILSGALLFVPFPAWAQTTPYNSLTLLWTAPGDDGNVGQVSSYFLRYSTSPVGTDTTGWWNGIPSSQRVTLGPPLASAGATDSATVGGLSQGTTYYFVIRALDEAANISGFSNVAVGTTPGTPGTPPPSGGGGSTVRIYPNPSSGPVRVVIENTAPSAQAVNLTLFDVNGHVIATLASNESHAPGSSEFTWDRTGRDGKRVAPGYYEVLGTVGSTRVRERIILLP